ncbi:MAG: hypothetical protein QXL15_03540 [Candidatus Korarchaeota archaeon]
MIVAFDHGLSAMKLLAIERDYTRAFYIFRPKDSALDNKIVSIIKNADLFIAVENTPQEIINMRISKIAKELDSTAFGALALAGLDKGIVVSMGTGTAFLVSDGKTTTHVGGTGVGGGLIEGIARYMNLSVEEFVKFSSYGDSSNVDLQVKHVYPAGLPTLPPDVTASNLARLEPKSRPEDIAAGVIRLVGEVVGVLSVLISKIYPGYPIVLVGGLTLIKGLERIIKDAVSLFSREKIQVIVPPHAHLATIIGAVLTTVDKSLHVDILRALKNLNLG